MRRRLSVSNAERTSRGIRAILYVRVSTVTQAEEGESLEAQRRIMEEECARRGIAEFLVIKDAGISGTQRERAGLDEALSLLKSGAYNLLMVTNLDRLARSTAHVLELAEDAKREQWDFCALGGRVQFDTSTPQGKLMLTMLAGFGEFERDMIRQRTIAAFDYKRAKGEEGYMTAETERRVLELFDAGHPSLREVAQSLNSEGVKTARGGVWHASTVRTVLARHGRAKELVKRGS